MSQLFTIPNSRSRTMNVPCTGKFDIEVHADGYWEVVLCADHGVYTRTRGTMSDAGTFYSPDTGEQLSVPDWMWDSICATMNELTIELERDALDTPQIGETWV